MLWVLSVGAAMAMQETRVVERESLEENRILLPGRMTLGAQPAVPSHAVSIPSIDTKWGRLRHGLHPPLMRSTARSAVAGSVVGYR